MASSGPSATCSARWGRCSDESDLTELTEGTALVTTFDLGLVIASASAGGVAGDQEFFVNSYVSQSPLVIGSVPIRPVYIAMFGACVVLAGGGGPCCWTRTRIGLRLRAIVHRMARAPPSWVCPSRAW